MKTALAILWASALCLPLHRSTHAAALHPEVGSPHYLLEQTPAESSEAPHFKIWEIRPSERTQNPLSGSRKIAEGSGRIQQFGISGYSLQTDRIVLGGPVWTLNQQGQLAMSQERTWRTYPEEVVALTGDANTELYAITRSGKILELTDETPREVGQVPAAVLKGSLHRTLEYAGLEFLDASSTLHRWNRANGHWTQHPLTGANAAWKVNATQIWSVGKDSVALTESGVSVQSAALDAPILGILAADSSRIIVRSGGHLWKLTPNVFGNRLSVELLAMEFYSSDLRAYGITGGLFSEVIGIRPTFYDRARVNRGDLAVGIYLPRQESLATPEVIEPFLKKVELDYENPWRSRSDEGHRPPVGVHRFLNSSNHPLASDLRRHCSEHLLPPHTD